MHYKDKDSMVGQATAVSAFGSKSTTKLDDINVKKAESIGEIQS